MSFRGLFPPTSKPRSPGPPWCAYNSAALSGASAMSATSVSAGARQCAAVDARTDPGFVIMARTDAQAVEGQAAALERAAAYVEAGADMIFAEALRTLEEFREFAARLRVPVLANITEFGTTPLFTTEELGSAGVRLVLYPLSAFRARRLQGQAQVAARPPGAGAERPRGAPRLESPDGRAAHRGVGARLYSARARRAFRPRGARHRRPPHRLARPDARVLVSLQP